MTAWASGRGAEAREGPAGGSEVAKSLKPATNGFLLLGRVSRIVLRLHRGARRISRDAGHLRLHPSHHTERTTVHAGWDRDPEESQNRGGDVLQASGHTGGGDAGPFRDEH